jgi:transposase
VGYTSRWVRTIVERYNRQGPPAISNHRLTLPGAKPLLTREQQQELDEALQQRPDDDGVWSGPKVASWMQDQLGRPVDARRGWDYMQRLSYSTHVPHPKPAEADDAAQQAFKKLPEEVELIRQAHPQATVELWSGDEHALGSNRSCAACGAKKGARSLLS